MHKNNPPYFLVGMERSGTTMLRLMLTHHPDIFFHHEFVYSVEKISPSGHFPEKKDYLAYLELDRIFKSENLNIIDSDSYVEIVGDFLSQLKKKNNNKPVSGATVHRNFQFLPKIWPHAKYIHMVRDPRDVAFSYVNKGWAGHVWTASDVWLQTEKTWRVFQESIKPCDYCTVHYEDLVRDPRGELQKICGFMGLSYSEDMLLYDKNSTYSAPDLALIGQWKKKNANDVRLIESKLKQQMIESGYTVSNECLKVSCFYDYYLRETTA
tara:strand:+ start:11794 stop:12594 length:801 start_codon:yes stop_codon:yes gene_type:complete